MKKGFTLIELVVVIAIIAVLSAIILFSISQYINTGKDSNISGNLAVLIPAGEVWYNGPGNKSYTGFCDFSNSVIKNIISQMPQNQTGSCPYIPSTPNIGDVSDGNIAGVCCNVGSTNNNAWAACAKKFADPKSAYCVDSRGMKKEIDNDDCTGTITECP